jgi:hypothetical protein
MTFDLNVTVLNTTAREQAQMEVSDRATILGRLEIPPIIMAISK